MALTLVNFGESVQLFRLNPLKNKLSLGFLRLIGGHDGA